MHKETLTPKLLISHWERLTFLSLQRQLRYFAKSQTRKFGSERDPLQSGWSTFFYSWLICTISCDPTMRSSTSLPQAQHTAHLSPRRIYLRLPHLELADAMPSQRWRDGGQHGGATNHMGGVRRTRRVSGWHRAMTNCTGGVITAHANATWSGAPLLEDCGSEPNTAWATAAAGARRG